MPQPLADGSVFDRYLKTKQPVTSAVTGWNVNYLVELAGRYSKDLDLRERLINLRLELGLPPVEPVRRRTGRRFA